MIGRAETMAEKEASAGRRHAIDGAVFPDNVHQALHDANLQAALGRFNLGFPVKRKLAIERLEGFEALRDAGKGSRIIRSIISTSTSSSSRRRSRKPAVMCIGARTPQTARQTVLDICREHGARRSPRASR